MADRYTGADDVEKLRSFAEEAIPSAVEHVRHRDRLRRRSASLSTASAHRSMT